MDSRASKRIKIAARTEDDYLPGSIVEIEVHNFMTYSHIKSQPGPRLNLVIGPNGTGKSSLVCAICVGLAGEPQLLGRAVAIGDYVKHGEECGWTKISLRGKSAEDRLAITRKINKRNKSEWLINDRAVSKRDVQEVVEEFNIQLNNLTQFLPQDKVSEFAKLSPIQLLEETQKAVGDPELSSQHKTLIERNMELKKLRITVSQLESSLEQHKASNAELEADGQRLRQRNQLLAQAEVMRKKLPWLRYDQKKLQFQEVKQREHECKKILKEATSAVTELRTPLDELRRRRVRVEEAIKTLLATKRNNEQKRRQAMDYETEMGAKARVKATEIQELHRQEGLRLEKIEKAKQDLVLVQEELENLPAYEPPEQKIQEIGVNRKRLEMQLHDLSSQRKEKEGLKFQQRKQLDHLKNRLQEIDDAKNRLLQALKQANNSNGINEAYNWVQSHRSEFRNEVFGPILLEVQVPRKEHSTYLENHVAKYLWKAFVTQNSHDRDFLVSNLEKFGVPIIHARKDHVPPVARTVTQQMQALGITDRLDQVFSAPAIVKQVLVTQAGLSSSFIGSSLANQRADEVNQQGVFDLWTPENHYRWQSSKYSDNISASVFPVRPGRLFAQSVDVSEKVELEQRIAGIVEHIGQIELEMRESEGQEKYLRDEAGKLEKIREELINQVKVEKKKRLDMARVIEQRRKKVELLENEEDQNSAELRIQTIIKEISVQRFQNIVQLKELLLEAGATQMLYASQHLTLISLDLQIREKDHAVRAKEVNLAEAQRTYDQCKNVTEQCRIELAQAKEAAEKIASLTQDLQAKFEEMPDTIEDLEYGINDLVEQANSVICNNPNVLEEYERRCEQIRNLTARLASEKDSLTTCLTEIETITGIWIPKLRHLVSKINDSFSQNFMEMAVAGEVSLDEHGTDFDKYGILIKVKFRETGELQVLSAHHQSGGERSVSTILYLVSLQDMTYCPFRVVDEINQGMDPNNERKMFQQLVRASSQPNTPQCLLLTPKLLPDLEYTEACTVLNVMNGPWLQEASTNWSSGATWTSLSQLTQT